MASRKIDKLQQLQITINIIIFLLLMGFVGSGLVAVLLTYEFLDILATIGVIAAGFGVLGLIYLAVGKWWPEIEERRRYTYYDRD